MKNHNQEKNEKNGIKNVLNEDFLLQKIDDPELQHIISDVMLYSEDYEIHIDNEDMTDWY